MSLAGAATASQLMSGIPGTLPARVAAARPLADGVVTELYGATRWVMFAGFAALIGVGYFVAVCWPGGRERRDVRLLAWGSWWALFAATALALLLYGPYVRGSGFGDPGLLLSAAGTRMGIALLARLILLGAAAAGLVLLLRSTARRWHGGAVLGAATALALTWAASSHSGSGAQVALALPADTAHLVAMAVWTGGLLVLGVALLRSGDVEAMAAAVPRFSRAALICVGVLVVTGLYQSWRQVGGVAALLGTSYGWVLLGKFLLVCLLVASGVLARRWVHRHLRVAEAPKRKKRRAVPAAAVRGFRRLVLVEAGVAAAVLLCTALLVDMQPARAEHRTATEPMPAGMPGMPGMPPEQSRSIRYDTGAGGGLVTIGLMPAMAHIRVTDDSGAPQQVRGVEARLRLPERGIEQPIPLIPVAGEHVAMGVQPSAPGLWQLDVTVRTSAEHQATVSLPLDAR